MTTSSYDGLEALLAEEAWARELATALVGRADGDDLVQKAFLEAAEGRYKPSCSPRAWLGLVLRNSAATLHRDRRRREAREQAVALTEVSDETPGGIEARLDQRRLLLELLGKLPAEQRAALVLRYEHGLEGAEIAQRLGCAESTPRVRIKRGLKALRAALDARPGGREVWVSGMLSLTLPPRSAVVAAAAAGGAPVVPWLIAAAAVLVLGLGWRLFGNPEVATPGELGPVDTGAVAVSDIETSPVGVEREFPSGGAALEATPQVEREGALAASAAEPTRLRVAFVDTFGEPVPFVEVQLLAGPRELFATADDHGVAQLETTELKTTALVTLTGREPDLHHVSDRFQVLPGRNNDLGALTLLAGSEIVGQALDVTGAGTAEATVAVLPADHRPPLEELASAELLSTLGRARLDAEGAFAFLSPLVGDLRLWFRGPDTL